MRKNCEKAGADGGKKFKKPFGPDPTLLKSPKKKGLNVYHYNNLLAFQAHFQDAAQTKMTYCPALPGLP
ncbi:MAG: hypothetical protein ACXVM0_17270, partial [Flavisolibacter sp.]